MAELDAGLDPLAQPLCGLPGAGPVTVGRLAERGIETVGDLLRFLPRGYDDWRTVYPLATLATLAEGTAVVVRGSVVRVHAFFRRLLDVYIEEDGVQLRARWFHPHRGMAKSFAKGAHVALAGCLRRGKDGLAELIQPSQVTAALDAGTLGLRPRYPLVEKVPGRTLEKMIAGALDRVSELPDILPPEISLRLGLPSLRTALEDLHRPSPSLGALELGELVAGRSPAHRRLALEDVMVVQLGLALERSRARQARALSCVVDVWGEVQSALPFALTAAQASAIAVIARDLAKPVPMQRLLQGDVGSGKTAVVFAAALQVARAGGQTVLMAPTEILAEQHLRTLSGWGQSVGLRVAVLHASLSREARRRVLDLLQAGQVDVLVGTHALISGGDDLIVPRPALAIVDEQHRFGVRQRARLRQVGGWIPDDKNGMVPHLLVLSATPIPRTLALTVYGDLELVTLNQVPPGRRPVVTQVGQGDAARQATWELLKTEVAAGGQAFVICPAIVEGKRRATSVLTRFRQLAKALAPARVGLLHGQMRSDEQQKVVDDLRARRLDVLVATTVVEVGVDVPSASLIVIEDAESFGLAQLHQLRGRVGRGGQSARCVLLTSTTDTEALDRLHAVAASSDGFAIAEEDLRRRGPGELWGDRQAGVPVLRFADLASFSQLVEIARSEADKILAADAELKLPEHARLRHAIESRWSRHAPIAEEAG
jgi:ATP-dependent DNA helicase RecG